MSTKNWRTEQQDAVTKALGGVEGLKLMKSNCTYRTTNRSAMHEAQSVVTKHGFRLSDVQMIEGAFYNLRYIPVGPFDTRPSWIVLQFDTEDLFRPVPLGLFYYDREDNGRTVLKRWANIPRFGAGYVYVTGTSEAEGLMSDFKFYAGIIDLSTAPFWAPLFDV